MWWVLGGIVAIAGGTFVYFYVYDRWVQRDHAIRRNFPIYGRFRYIMENLGEYFRQYWFTADWEERPFNRLTRAWVYRSAKAVSNYVAFGSEVDAQQPGHIYFLHSAFPVNDDEAEPYTGKWIGKGVVANPFKPNSFFNISGMSYGALSSAAVTALSEGAALAGIWLDTGEGGLSPYHLKGNCDVVFQIGTAKYGVRDKDGRLDETKLAAIAALPQVKMFCVKLSQGAKPGRGGILPAAKVNDEIAGIRLIEPHKASISPSRHPEITDVRSLVNFIGRVRDVTNKPVGIKMALGDERFIDALFEYLRERPMEAPDFIQLDGGEGGTGAAPAPLADYVGQSIVQALPLLAEKRRQYGLRNRIRIIASGKLLTPDKVAWALCQGADFVVSARGYMFALGCIQAMKCNTGHCPTGVTSNEPRFMRGLDPARKAVRVANYAKAVQHDVEAIAHACGCKSPRDLKAHHVRVQGETLKL
ncbi:FMN-binding glutamate synthase family protein [Ferrovibrio sp.]|uniref:FMN-binding glutamate synthase family protein n=1 Tax=Ferrovibrio sp. TaxID=1917215 RepID=UPI003D26CE65